MSREGSQCCVFDVVVAMCKPQLRQTRSCGQRILAGTFQIACPPSTLIALYLPLGLAQSSCWLAAGPGAGVGRLPRSTGRPCVQQRHCHHTALAPTARMEDAKLVEYIDTLKGSAPRGGRVREAARA